MNSENSGRRSFQKTSEAVWQERAQRQKRGQGEQVDYSPWIQVRRGDFSSRGVSYLIPNRACGRQHNLLSTLEANVRLYLWQLGFHQAYEQVPLWPDSNSNLEARDISSCQYLEAPGTLDIARGNSIKHPRLSNGDSRVMTTDLVVKDSTNKSWAIFVRYSADVPSIGTRDFELLHIAREYWEYRGTPLLICTEKDISTAQNALQIWCYDGYIQRQTPSSLFLQFLTSQDSFSPLQDLLKLWQKGGHDAMVNFKSAVFGGWLTVNLESTRLPSLRQPWPWRITTANDQVQAWWKFACQLKERNG